MSGLLGKKIGMTQIFSDSGSYVSVTAIEAGPCPVLAVKERSVQLGFETANVNSLKRPVAGYFTKLNIAPRKIIAEVKKAPNREYKVGEDLKVDMFKPGDFVDVTGISIGKGFQGGLKRWNWKGGPMTHGSTSHRRIGSLGSTTTPGRVWKGHHLPGHMGNVRVTVQNLKVVKVDPENNLLLVKGAVPGHKNSYLTIRAAKKKQGVAKKIMPTKAAGAKKK
jgi:large subunit ribosomal protein L3